MIVKLLTEHHLEFLSLKGVCRCSSESTHVKMSNCWKSHAAARMCVVLTFTDRLCNNTNTRHGRIQTAGGGGGGQGIPPHEKSQKYRVF